MLKERIKDLGDIKIAGGKESRFSSEGLIDAVKFRIIKHFGLQN